MRRDPPNGRARADIRPSPAAEERGPPDGYSTDSEVLASHLICVDRQSCYASLTRTSGVLAPGDRADPMGSKLVRALRSTRGEGDMPRGSAFVFERGDIERIANWIARGAPDD